jgi:hypothetical protein
VGVTDGMQRSHRKSPEDAHDPSGMAPELDITPYPSAIHAPKYATSLESAFDGAGQENSKHDNHRRGSRGSLDGLVALLTAKSEVVIDAPVPEAAEEDQQLVAMKVSKEALGEVPEYMRKLVDCIQARNSHSFYLRRLSPFAVRRIMCNEPKVWCGGCQE